MKKIIWYITIFIAFYLQLSIIIRNQVIAVDDLNISTPQLIIPESSGFGTGNLFLNNSIVTSTGISQPIEIENIIQNNNPPINNNNNNNDNNNNDDDGIETYFIVTAYYSPLPNQEHYLKGNYQDEIILNGKGIRGASGKDVFPGMFAGPKNYHFGTKIYLEGVGIGEISDRGGAIISTATGETRGYEYDRIDIWMGFGEEGLKKALAWGKRKVKGKLLFDNNSQINVDLNEFPSPDYVVKNLEYRPFIEKNISSEYQIFEKYIGPESSEENIKELQKIFTNMSLYNGNIDGKYENIKDILISYQIKLGVIDIKTDNGAGYFGPKTRIKAKQDYISYIDSKNKQQEERTRKEAFLVQIQETIRNKVEKHIASIGNPKPGDIGENVKNLQKTLNILGYLHIKESTFFGDKTKIGLIKYQLEKGIVKNRNDNGAGYFGPKTEEIIKMELVSLLEKQVLKERNLLSYKK